MTAMFSSEERSCDRTDQPLDQYERRDRWVCPKPAADVPEDLRSMWSSLSPDVESGIVEVERGLPDNTPSEPQRPDWIGASLRPRRGPRVARPRVELRGLPMEPMTIIPPDGRVTYNDPSYPWGCVCHVQGRFSAGSGVIVGPRHVLTASHVVDWDGPAETIMVHRVGGAAQAVARTQTVWSYTKIKGDPGYSTVDEDYAVLVTDQRIGDRFGWLGVRTYNSDWDDESYWTNMGYAGDVAHGTSPIYQQHKSMDEDEWDYGGGRAMTTNADVMPRQSGSPMFGWWSDGPYVVAVVSAVGQIVLSGDENWCSGGNDLTRLVKHARAKMP